MSGTGLAALRDLRSHRQRNRLGDIEWFDAAYRVYLAALIGGGAVLWLSDLVGDDEITAAQAVDVARHGPGALGVLAILAVCLGLRSGSQGGPLALEQADVVHVMLSPVDRRRALLRPVVQRVRSAAFLGVVFGAIAGEIAGRRLPGSALAWSASGAAFGAIVATLWIGSALLAHGMRLRLPLVTSICLALLSWQGAAAVSDVPGPGNLAGALALWGMRQRVLDLVAAVAAIGITATGAALAGRVSLDALSRRSSLVAQLRFAVTMQDLRTVILLRRQLTLEHMRRRPWLRVPPGRRGSVGAAVWRRGWYGLLRFPPGRLLRMSTLAAAAGACQVAAYHGTTPATVATAVLTFVLGLELLEPLSQEVDQPDRTDSFPVERGDLLVRHLGAPLVAAIPFALVGGAAAVTVHGLIDGGGGVAVIAVLALPTVLSGVAGGAVNIVRDAPDPISNTAQQTFLPPEMAGITTVTRMIVPLVVSFTGAAPVLFLREVVDGDGSAAAVGAAVRGALFALVIVVLVTAWIRMRDRFRRALRRFMAEGRAAARQGRTA